MKALAKTTSGWNVAELSHDECVALSRTAECMAVIDLAPSMGEYHFVYEDGVMRQVRIERHVLDEVAEIVGRAQPFDAHLGWIS